ncbi:glycosyltransferase family 4 protein [Roseibacterium sp. SDUM158016]|uniref:glycosyltransferase family 4 protein n=1 Tax=Roseicyclus sediminis TaxID=2980997 RepID=UPI0021D2A3F8|nr:glycosyltransferase family 4 protein [Roseibacterium sp. SDUM158016]MCU4653756.1 glycosyltransferase family 4 protein [Roseibacterium sp. SDUM158016]
MDFWGVDAGAGVDTFVAQGQTFPVRFFGKVKTGRKFVPNVLRVTWQLRSVRRTLLEAGYDGIYIHGVPLNAALPRQANGPKRINHVHGLTNPFLMHGEPGPVMRRLARSYESYRRHVVAMSDLVLLAADHKGIDQFRSDHPGNTRIEKIENFCDTSVFGGNVPSADRMTYGLPELARLIVHVGRFAYQKDPLLAVRAFSAYLSTEGTSSGDRLVMIGDGPLLPDGKALAQELGISDSVVFLGHQPREAIATWLAAADLYLYTSHANGYPISLAEAAQSGLPIVSTAVSGVNDLVIPGKTGVLVHDREPQSFVKPIEEALANRAAYGKCARELAAQYTPERIVDRLCQAIADAL